MKLEKNLLVFCEKHLHWVRIVKGAEINFRYGNKKTTTLKDLKKCSWFKCSMDCSLTNDIMVIYDEYDEYKMEGGGGVITL